ncbi:MAG: ABC transporter ATP-binding protein/permease [Oscillospiraceae bacterium]|nr:ABC transporter ATP-binding protein/permease [Oscillospiraceae bacterium]
MPDIETSAKKMTLKDKAVVTGWAFKLAWGYNRTVLLGWLFLSGALSVFPALALLANRRVLSQLNTFLATGTGTFADIVAPLLVLGALLIVIGLSSRINDDFVNMMVYEHYYMAIQSVLMDAIHRVKMSDLLKRETYDKYLFAASRGGSLSGVIASLCLLAGKLVGIVSLLAVAASLSWPVFIVSVVYIVVIVLINLRFTEGTRGNANKRARDQRHADYLAGMPEAPGIAKEIRIFDNTETVIHQWRRLNGEVVKDEVKRRTLVQIKDAISNGLFYVFLAVILVITLFKVAAGDITTAVYLVLYTLCMNLFGSVSGLAGQLLEWDYSLFALHKQYDFVKTTPLQDPADDDGKADAPLDAETVYEVKNLSFAYNDNAPLVLNDVSFFVRKGDVVALVGENGSGKTTLIKLLIHLYAPRAGTIKLFGRLFDEYKSDFLRRHIGVFFQDFEVFHHTFRENVGFGDVEHIADMDRILQAIDKGGARKLIDQLPFGLETLFNKEVDPSGVNLSGGERQRVGSARAHMSDRDVLIFDEPASALDPIAEMEQFEGIRQKVKGRTAILISHRVGFARLADKIIMMDKGHIAETGTHEELMAKGGLYAYFFHEQAQWYEKGTHSAGTAGDMP